jgi:hypothetical protein
MSKQKNVKLNKQTKIAFEILAIICLILLAIAITPKVFQNDTFYTIKIGQSIRQNGIDYKDHYSWHKDLKYLYPHWMYDVITSYIYDYCGGFQGLYIATIALAVFLEISLYYTNKKITKNQVIAFLISMFQLYFMGNYTAARAQSITFPLFVLTILLIEKLLETGKIRYMVGLVIIPILIANLHSAVFPFYFILFLPYLGEDIVKNFITTPRIRIIHKQILEKQKQIYLDKIKKFEESDVRIEEYKEKIKECESKIKAENLKIEKYLSKTKDLDNYKLRIATSENIKKLYIVFIICLFTGLLTPLKDMPYTYTYRIMKGNTTQAVSEHQPMILINEKKILISYGILLAILIFTKTKIRLRDLFFLSGLFILSIMTRRQESMLILFGGIVFARILTEFIQRKNPKLLLEIQEYLTTIFGEIGILIIVLLMSTKMINPKFTQPYIDETSYPVEASHWIKEKLDYKNIKLFNDYNYGSYLLFEDIPVFIDSRCDLYTPEFNGTYNKNSKKFVGKDIFSDFLNVSQIATWYDNVFKEYGATHVITGSSSKLNMLISKDPLYNKIYSDKNFVLYERVINE